MPSGISLSCCATRGAARRKPSSRRTATISARARRSTSTRCSTTFDADALGTSRHPRRTRVSHLAVLSRLKRAASHDREARNGAGILAVALAGAILTYGGVSLFVAFFVLVPMAQSLFKAADIPTGWCLRLASEHGIDPALLHRIAVMSAGTLDSLPHNGAVLTLLAVCGVTHRDSYKDIFVVAIVGVLLALAAVIVLGSIFGSF